MPTPEQIKAAMPAMRGWLRENTTAHAAIESYTRVGVEWLIDVHYPGGVAQFIKDQEERRRCPVVR